MSTLTLENIPNLCRACLRNLTKNRELPLQQTNATQQQPAYYHIERLKDLNKWMAIINPLEEVTRLNDTRHYQRYPKLVCRSCYENFKHVNDFKEMVVHSFSVLTKLLAEDNEPQIGSTILQSTVTQDEVVIKSEPIDEDEELFEGSEELMEEEQNESEENFVDGDKHEEKVLFLKKDVRTQNVKSKQESATSSSATLSEVGQPKATKNYKCTICNISYIHKYTYVAHIRQMHMGIEHAFECDMCHKTYTKFCNLYRHMRKDHNQSLRQYKCEYKNCNRSFRQLTTRRKHYKEFHRHEPLPNSETETKINYEQKNLNNPHNTRNSQRSFIETSSKTFTLSSSSATTVKNSNDLVHDTPPLLPTLTHKRNYICAICASSFETSYDLKVHMNSVHRDQMKFRCHICGTLKISQLKLDEHMNTVHEQPKVTCDICQKVLKSKSHLRQHILSVHNGVKPFSCEYCPATFAAKNTLKVHTRIHTGEKPFKCAICERRFTQLTPMKKHMITHEKGHRNAIE